MGHSFLNAPVNRVQTKYLSADVTSDGAVSDLTFSNLTIGKWYELSLQASYLGGDKYCTLYATHDGNVVVRLYNKVPALGNGDRWVMKSSHKFKATAQTITFETLVDGGTLEGNGTISETHAQLEERNDLIETSDW